MELPKHRSCMHLDTVMTHMDGYTSVYPEVIRKDVNCWSLTPGGATGMNIKEEGYFVTAIEKALGWISSSSSPLAATASRPSASSGTTPTTC